MDAMLVRLASSKILWDLLYVLTKRVAGLKVFEVISPLDLDGIPMVIGLLLLTNSRMLGIWQS